MVYIENSNQNVRFIQFNKILDLKFRLVFNFSIQIKSDHANHDDSHTPIHNILLVFNQLNDNSNYYIVQGYTYIVGVVYDGVVEKGCLRANVDHSIFFFFAECGTLLNHHIENNAHWIFNG